MTTKSLPVQGGRNTSLVNASVKGNPEKGQAVIMLVTAMSIFMLGALGLAIDGSTIYSHRQMAQAAADAAAQSAAMSLLRGTNSTATYPFTATTFTCAVPPAVLDRRTPCVYAQHNGFGGTGDLVTVSFPGTVPGVTLASLPAPAVSVTVQRTLKTGFIGLLGPSTYTVIAKGASGITGSVSPNCIHSLDPSAQDAFIASNGASVTMNCGIAVNSNNATAAFKATGGASVTATAIKVVGHASITNGATATPGPTEGVAPVADPFASMPPPPIEACKPGFEAHYNPHWGNFTLWPGTYCGGITMSNGATALFKPGVYVIKGGALTLVGGTTISGDGVMFYLTGTNADYRSVAISNGANVTFTAQTSGTHMGLLFFQDRSITSTYDAAFSGGVALRLTGSLYFPTTNISYSNGSSSNGFTTALLAKKVSFTGGVNLTFDPTGLKTGLLVKTVALVK